MEWEKIDELLRKHIEEEIDLNEGYIQINKFLSDHGLPNVNIDIEVASNKFANWLNELLKKEPIPKNIKSIYFGLAKLSFPELKNSSDKTTIYISGSHLSPAEDEDWACEMDYSPNGRYFILDDFEKIDAIIENNSNLSGDFEVLVFNGILNLIIRDVINSCNHLMKYKEKRFGLINSTKKRNELNYASGYDSGDIYILGKLT